MLSLRRSFRSIAGQIKKLSVESSGTTLGIGRGRGKCIGGVPQQPVNTSTVEAEKNFVTHRKVGLWDSNPCCFSPLHVHFHMRSMTTVGQVEDSVGQDTSTDTLLPQRIKVKRLDKTSKHIMNILDKEAVDKIKSEREIPDVEAGYVVEIKLEAPENKGRVSTIKGLVIARRNAGISTTIRVRRLESSVGTETLLPLYSPNIKSIKVLEKRSVRRAKLYYIRERPFNVAMRELAQRTSKKKEMLLRAKRAERPKKN